MGRLDLHVPRFVCVQADECLTTFYQTIEKEVLLLITLKISKTEPR